jgi:hypothetical protein
MHSMEVVNVTSMALINVPVDRNHKYLLNSGRSHKSQGAKSGL